MEVWLTLILFCSCLTLAKARQKLLLVSFDGLRWDYTDDVDTPNFDDVSRSGVRVPYLTPCFVSLSGPCHWTMVTGQYPESHGVVHNVCYDVTTGERIDWPDSLTNSRWMDAGAEPIWITAKRQGKRVGTCFFPGGSVAIKGMRADKIVPMATTTNTMEDWKERVDTVITWLSRDDLDLVTLYFNQPDLDVHYHGVGSEERKDMVRQADSVIGYLRDEIRRNELEATLNVIVTSDHGAQDVNTSPRQIELLNYVPESYLQFYLADYGPLAIIQPKEGRLEEVYTLLSNVHPNMTVYKKEEFPPDLHWANHPRVPDILAMADPTFVIYSTYPGYPPLLSEHGWDPRLPDMRAYFRAFGPSFKADFDVAPFESVNLYPLMCQVLGVAPAPNNGSLSLVGSMLRDDVSSGQLAVVNTAAVTMATAAAILLGCQTYS
ncbi:ectonucleotide pyrophosphatase/phosphodiesterase family member 7-like [Branchiostoma floridae]|uniref:Ectonucleotide pyrophosphatase/phosphodiesterase family member 7-like n=1 Tax=Branchiostoma floridae TaxID=7739 RepID=A0A9J7M2U9_BRAFL|nr:ectonucleotide pyrophosphatase/phosphodiesterase family member 7-like [Branchiostoma floridae]